MKKLRAAILEDNPILLKDLVRDIQELDKLEVVINSTSTSVFCKEVDEKKPDCLIMDIDISGDSINGIDICNKFKLPTLFVSGKNSEYYRDIEELNLNSDSSIMHISKPVTMEKLGKILPKFIKSISLQRPSRVKLRIQGQDEFIELQEIVCLTIHQEESSRKSNNKRIYFTNRQPEILKDFSFTNLKPYGFPEEDFIQIHRSSVVNKAYANLKNVEGSNLNVEGIKTSGKQGQITLTISEDHKNKLRKALS